MEPEPSTAQAMLADADGIAHSVRAADTVRRNIYMIQALVVVLCIAPYDAFQVLPATVACLVVVAAGLALTLRSLGRSRVIDREAMTSYMIVIGSWSVLWLLLMTVVGPWLSDRSSIGWTLTGLIGTIPYLAGMIWERRR